MTPTRWSNARRGSLGLTILGTVAVALSIAQRVYHARYGERATAIQFDAELGKRHNAAMDSMEAFLSIAVAWCRGGSIDPAKLASARRSAVRDADAYVSMAEGNPVPDLPHASELRNQARHTALALQVIAVNDGAEIEKQIGDGSPGKELARQSVAFLLEDVATRIRDSAGALHREQVNFRESTRIR